MVVVADKARRARSPAVGRAAHPTAGRRAVHVCLAANLALLPIGQALHVVLAAHDHRYCPVHRRIEDVPRTPAREAPVPRNEPGLEEAPRPTEHVPCAVLNAASPSIPRLRPPHTPPAVPHGAAVTSPLGPPPPHPARLILLAPKTSPPTAVGR